VGSAGKFVIHIDEIRSGEGANGEQIQITMLLIYPPIYVNALDTLGEGLIGSKDRT